MSKQRLPVSSGSGVNGLHGGDVMKAAKLYGGEVADWLDLSTGMNPEPWAVPVLPQTTFEQLPYEWPEFRRNAIAYYGREQLLAVAGTQAAIQALPNVLPCLPILLPGVGYQEHHRSWRAQGAEVIFYPSLAEAQACTAIEAALAETSAQHLLVINPNNPSGLTFAPAELLRWAERLSDGACLIVDEAFIDVTPEQSLLSHVGAGHDWPENLIVLRSFGKFFGLAGIRLGFVFAASALREALERWLGLWGVNGPAQYVASLAFTDSGWQQQQRRLLPQASSATRALFEPLLSLSNDYGEVRLQAEKPLFNSYVMSSELALELQDFFAKQAILLRVVALDNQRSLLRVGLLPSCVQRQRRVRDTLAAFIARKNKIDDIAHRVIG